MRPTTNRLLRQWFGLLGLSRQSPPSWYRDRLREELSERRTATTRLAKLSETSDVFFAIIRAQHDGFAVRKLPPFSTSCHALVYMYMVPKYTLRWQFYRLAARLCNTPNHKRVCEVVNPGKDHKLEEVAFRHRIDPPAFVRVGRQLRRFWPLMP